MMCKLLTVAAMITTVGCITINPSPPPALVDLGGEPEDLRRAPTDLSNLVCLTPSTTDACYGATLCIQASDCQPDRCRFSGNSFGTCVEQHCFWFDPGPNPPAPGPRLCFTRPADDPCSGKYACDDDNKDCKPAFCGDGVYGICLAKRCYWRVL